LADAKEIVAAGYDRVADRYAALEGVSSEWPRLRRLEALLADLPSGSRVLDVGCGNGLPALTLIARSHTATGIDISAVQSAGARRNVPTADVIHGDVAAQDFPAASFDAIVAFYVLEHLPREEHGPLFARFALWLRPGGDLLFTTETGDDSGRVSEWLDVPMYFSQFDEETTARLLDSAGLDLVRRDSEFQREGDREVGYVWFHARRRS
jgi:cyclopropane fatty-acyl-phospholipid synthase-like methyltransferase